MNFSNLVFFLLREKFYICPVMKHLFILFILTFFRISFSIAQVENLSGKDSAIFISHTIFLPKYVTISGSENWGVCSADFDSDGDIDLASVSKMDSKVNIHLNDGKGQLSSKQSFSTGAEPRAICTADFNKDGKPDLAAISTKDGRLYWYLNQGAAKFSEGKSQNSGVFLHWVTAADVTGDGNLDLLTVSNAQSSISIHANDGTGNFAAAKTINITSKPRMIQSTDMNADGANDLVVSCDDGYIYILHNQAGNFQVAHKLMCGGNAIWGFALADVNKDKLMDIVAASYINERLYTFLANEDKKYDAQAPVLTGAFNFDVVLEDFDLDGDIDAASCSSRDGNVNVHLNNGKGIFGKKDAFISGNWNSRILAADMDGDGDKDLITSSIRDNSLNVHRNISIEPEKEKLSAPLVGTIRDLKTNQPVVSIVSVMDSENKSIASAKTDNQGNYKFIIPFGTNYKVVAKAPSYPEASEKLDFPKTLGKEGTRKDLFVNKVTGTFVYGTVIDRKTKKPLQANIEIKDVYGNNVATLVCDASGNYKQELPFAKNYAIKASLDGYTPKKSEFSLFQTDAIKGVQKNFELDPIEVIKIICVEGTTFDAATKEKVLSVKLKLLDEQGNVVAEYVSDSVGYYKMCSTPGNYKIETSHPTYLASHTPVTLVESQNPVKQDIPLEKMEIGKKFVLKNIFYDVDKATLRKESVAELERLLKIMQENPTLSIEISGHTDSDGSDEHNLTLSQNRAQSVVNYLTEREIDPNRLVAKGYGETQPVAPNDTPANKQKNRRTEMKVLKF